MKEKILKQIKRKYIKESLKTLVAYLFFGFFILGIIVEILLLFIKEGNIFIFFFALLIDITILKLITKNKLFKELSYAIYPQNSEIFKNYGSPDKVANIIENNKINISSRFSLSDKYFFDSIDYESLVAIDDIERIYFQKHYTKVGRAGDNTYDDVALIIIDNNNRKLPIHLSTKKFLASSDVLDRENTLEEIAYLLTIENNKIKVGYKE